MTHTALSLSSTTFRNLYGIHAATAPRHLRSNEISKCDAYGVTQ